LQDLAVIHERLTRVPDVNRLTQLKVGPALAALAWPLRDTEGPSVAARRFPRPRWQSLCLRQNRIRVIEGLDALTQLEELDMYDNLISEIRGLEKLTNLT